MGSLKDRHKWYTVIERPIWPIEAHSIVKCKSKMFESTYRTHYPEEPCTPKMSNVHLTWFLLEPQKKKPQPLNHNPQESAGILGAEETKLEENSLKSLKRYMEPSWNLMEPKKCCFAKRNVRKNKGAQFQVWGDARWALPVMNGA